jgi:hypothetical protein
MRILAGIVLVVFSLLSVGCAVHLQPPQQGEWSDFHSDKDKVSEDAKPKTEKPAEK